MEYILYHDKCQDGLLSAATFKKCGIGDKFIGCRYGDPFPIPVDTLTKDDDVYIVDFSFSRETLLEIRAGWECSCSLP